MKAKPELIFLWSARNEEHLAKHGVSADESMYVVEHARLPYPRKVGDDKRLVWGKTDSGRLLQAVFVEVFAEDVTYDEFERLELYERLALNAGDLAVRVIHARELTKSEQTQLRRRRRGR